MNQLLLQPDHLGSYNLPSTTIDQSKNHSQSILSFYSVFTIPHSTYIIYVTDNGYEYRVVESPYYTSVVEDSGLSNIDDSYTRFTLLFPNINTILIPQKVKVVLQRHVPRGLLYKIDADIDRAIEKCLVFLSYLASTYYTEDKWKQLSSVRLHDQLKNGGDNTYIYKRIIEALLIGTTKHGPIIEIMKNEEGFDSYEIGVSHKQYRLSERYLRAGLEVYLIQDDKLVQARNKTYYRAFKEAYNNPIARNLIHVYPSIDIPSIDEVMAEGKRLTKMKYRTKKGKVLTMRNGHSDVYWKDASQRSFVEDHARLFQFLTGCGFMIPIIGGESSGGRVVDSFTLMPSWIRNMIKINGESVVESDYSALHPNLANKIYGGTGNHISHQLVADALGIDKSIAKIEHLSFFNKPYYPKCNKFMKYKGSMVESRVYPYYQLHEPEMLNRIKEDKILNGYTTTSTKLFQMEVQLMSEVVKQLNEEGVEVVYVYDALYCAQSKQYEVVAIMNQVVFEYGVNTMAG